MRYVAILAGGSGTRLWPLSRKGEPKQLLDLVGGKSLLRLAYERVASTVPDANILVCAGAGYVDVVAAQLPELPASNILGEPVGRDSVNAVAWTTAVVVERDPDAVVAVLSADHIITPIESFREALDTAFRVAETDASALVTFGVVPTSPQTGFGYLHRGAELAGFPGCNEVAEFAEKPTAEVAAQYLASGNYWWNSGMFVWRANTLMELLQQLLPDNFAQISELAAHPDRLADIYPQLAKTSVDYAIMEPVSVGKTSAHVVAVPLAINWVDLGGYQALFENLPSDADGNRARGPVVSIGSQGNLLINTRGDNSVLAVSGISDMVVVTTPTATLVVPLADAQSVKELVAQVAAQVSPELA